VRRDSSNTSLGSGVSLATLWRHERVRSRLHRWRELHTTHGHLSSSSCSWLHLLCHHLLVVHYLLLLVGHLPLHELHSLLRGQLLWLSIRTGNHHGVYCLSGHHTREATSHHGVNRLLLLWGRRSRSFDFSGVIGLCLCFTLGVVREHCLSNFLSSHLLLCFSLSLSSFGLYFPLLTLALASFLRVLSLLPRFFLSRSFLVNFLNSLYYLFLSSSF